jgi:hypothetical protein
MGRWLAPLLPGPQHWVLHDQDPDLLALAVANPPPAPAAVTVTASVTDITQMQPGEFADASLITASALLDVLTDDEMSRLVGACAAAACPSLLTLSVTGEVALTPADPLDERIAAAFNDHQRRATERGRLLGPDAVEHASREFRRLGADVIVRPSPWQLGPAQAALIAEWLDGWVGAASEQHPELIPDCASYTRRRLDQLSAGELEVTVGHADLLALP